MLSRMFFFFAEKIVVIEIVSEVEIFYLINGAFQRLNQLIRSWEFFFFKEHLAQKNHKNEHILICTLLHHLATIESQIRNHFNIVT